MSTAEQWRPIAGWPYEVSDRGRVRRRGGDRVLRPDCSSGGYERVQLNDAPRTRRFLVHHLVAGAFLPPAPGRIGKRAGDYQLNHIDGDKKNNRPENLEWVTPRENHRHASRAGLKCRGVRHHNSKLDPDAVRCIRERAAGGETQPSIARDFGITKQCVRQIVNGVTWRHVRRAA